MRDRSSRFAIALALCLALVTMCALSAAAETRVPVRSDGSTQIQSAPAVSEPHQSAGDVRLAGDVRPRLSMATDSIFGRSTQQARNISLDFHAEDITTVLKALSLQSGTNIVTGTDVKGPVTVSLNRVSLSEALDMITKLSGYKCAEVGPDTYVVGSLPGVSGVMGDESGATVSAAIPLFYSEPDPLGKILEARFGIKYTPTGAEAGKPGPKVLVVSGPKSVIDEAKVLVAQVEDSLHDQQAGQAVEIYILKYISAKDAALALTTVLPRLIVTIGPGTGLEDRPPAGVTFMQSNGAATATAAVQREEPRTVILSGSLEDVAQARGLLTSLDTKPKQVLIEARVTDITLGAEKRLGITWAWSSIGIDEGTKTSGAGSGKFHRLPMTIDAQLDAMLEDNAAKLLANPTIAALEGKPATIFIGDEIKYIIRIEETLTGKTFQTETANVGVTLRVTARPDDDGFITLALHPEVSTISAWLSIGTGTGGNSNETAVALPQIARRFTDHVVRVKDGETIAIGGLIRDTEINNLTKIPILGDLPFFGGLFKHREKSKEHSEIAIFLKASVMKDI